MTPVASQIIESYALSPTQAGMLYHALREANTGVDIEQVSISLREAIDESRFLRAWIEVIRRHSILRTRFRWEGIAQPQQEVVAEVDLPVDSVDWTALHPGDVEDHWSMHVASDRLRDFDLTKAPAMRLFIARISSNTYRILWTFHHALLDGRSFPVVLREVFAIYEAALRGAAISLPEPRPYRKFIERLEALDWAAAETYWREALQGIDAATPFGVDTAELGAARTLPPGKPYDARTTRLSRQLTSRLRDRASKIGVTINTLLQGAWAVLLHRYSGQSQVVFGTTRAGRNVALGTEGPGLVGLFINTVPVRVEVSGDLEVVAWLGALREQQLRTRPFEHAPLVKVQSWSSIARGKPLFESVLVYDHESLDTRLRSLGGAWKTRHFDYVGQTNYPLTIVAYGDDEMMVRFEYARRRFTDSTIERMCGHFVTVLEALADGESRRIKDLSILNPAERAALLASHEPLRCYPRGSPLHEQFERQAQRTPDALALTAFGDSGQRIELSYAELNRRANRIAHRLRAVGVVPDQLVGLRTERNIELVIGILAILKSGAAYLPLDPVYPRDRVAFMLEDARVEIVLTQSSLKADLTGIAATIVCLDEPIPSGPESQANLPTINSADDLAYVIYTSGSTGKPKGVRISHHNVSRLFAATDHWYGFDERDVWPLFHSYAFDVSVWEFWGAFLHGGRLIVVPYWVSRSPDAFRQLVVQERVTVLNQTPSAFQQYLQGELAQPAAEHALRLIIFAGEALELQSLRSWFERYGDAKPLLVNKYGITETTVHVTYRPIALADLDAGVGSVIGAPMLDLKIYILDPQGEPVPIGVSGEMYVSGAGVGLGYLNRPELTAQRFLRDPFDADPSARMYRSGDLARRLDNGDIEYLGRIDQQVKIRGFRIELGEIEARIAQHPQVRQVAVIAREDVAGDKRLVAYIVAAEEQGQIVDQLRESIRAVMPDYMMPAHFVFLPGLPLTHNGKLDRRALPAPASARTESAKPFIAPRNSSEQAIADVWKKVLRIDQVSVDDHFFELGGDSILSIQVIARCREHGLLLTPKDLFSRPTISQLAKVVRTAPSATKAPTDAVSGAVPMTPIQHWFFEQRFADPQHWNQAFLFEVPGDLDVSALEGAFRKLVSRHDALRMRFATDAGGRWTQRYGVDELTMRIGRVDLTALASNDHSAAIATHAATAQGMFNLESGPLLCAVHFNLGSDVPGRLLIAVHHLVVDGVSWRILREDLESLYLNAVGKVGHPLPQKTSSLHAWANALHAYAKGASTRNAFEHWRGIEREAALQFPQHDAQQPASPMAERFVTQLSSADTLSLLQRLPAKYQTQINDVLLTALALALQRWTGSNRIRIDLEGHGREHIAEGLDISRTVGWFTTLFPIALSVNPAASTSETLLAVREQLKQVPDRGLSYGLLRYLSSDAGVRAALSMSPSSPVLFNYLGQFDSVVADSSLFAFAKESTGPWRSPRAKPTHTLEVVAVVREGRLEIAWGHDVRAGHALAVERAAEFMMGVLRGLISHAGSAVGRELLPSEFPLSTMDSAALAQLVLRYPQMVDAYPLTPMQRLFFVMEASQAGLGFEQWHFRLDGALDTALLRQAIEHVIERHSMLRTGFIVEGGAEPHQVVLSAASLPWSEEDWRSVAEYEQTERIAALLASDARVGFDLARPPLMRVAVRRIAERSYHLVWSTHHLCIDGWSWPIVFGDVSRVYAQLEIGKEAAVEEATSFSCYVKWLRDCAPPSEEFWKGQLDGFVAPTPLRLSPAGSAEASVPRGEGFAEVIAKLPVEPTRALETLARSAHVTLSTLFGGAWSLLLAHYSGLDSVVFGAAFSGRPAEIDGIESLVGPCVTNLPVRARITPTTSLKSWLVEIQQQQFDMSQHQYASVEQIQRWAGIPWRHRLFDSLIVFQNYQIDADARRIGQAVRSSLISAPEATNYALTLAVSMGERLRIRFLFKPDELVRADVDEFAVDLVTVLSAMTAGDVATIGDILQLLPSGSRGKARQGGAIRSQAAYVAPSSQTELEVASVWQELFGVEQISLDDNFFDLGGHSVLLVQAHARLQAKLGVHLPIVTLLQYPTVRSLARHLSGEADTDREEVARAAMARAKRQRQAQSRQRTFAGGR